MKGKFYSSLIGLALIPLIHGCDVSNNDDSSETVSAQDGDPVVIDFPIAYIQRPLPRQLVDEDGNGVTDIVANDVFDPLAFNPGAKLILKDRASVTAAKTILTDAAFLPEPDEEGEVEEGEAAEETPTTPPLYDVKDLNVSSDGTKLIFAMRAPAIPDADEDEQPTWNIWEYSLETEILRRVIESDLSAEAGQDVQPAYLADGGIIFSSTRQRRSKAILLDESKPQFSAVTEGDDESETLLLHVMNEDGLEIDQVTYNQSHDLQPTLLSNGKVMFLRWDNYSQNGGDDASANDDRLSLYTINPNGSDLSRLYGFHSPGAVDEVGTPGMYFRPREMPPEMLDDMTTSGQKILVSYRPRQTSAQGGDLVVIDTENFIDINQPVNSNIGDTSSAEQTITVASVVTDALDEDGNPRGASPHGYFSSAYPLFDNTDRLLVSWSPCLILGFKLDIFVEEILGAAITNGDNEVIGREASTFRLIDIDGNLVDRDGNPLAEGATAITVPEDEVGAFPCNEDTLDNDAIAVATPRYGLWVYDPTQETQAPVELAEEEVMYTEAVVLQLREAPTFIPGPIRDEATQALIDENVGILHIRSVYDIDGEDTTPAGLAAMADPSTTPVNERPARFIRILKAVSRPHEDDFDLDFDLADGIPSRPPKDIIGYAPIRPDGSAMFKVPADVAFSISIIDAEGKRVEPPQGYLHKNWLTVRAGEVRTCNGCHTPESELPHGRMDAEPPSINTLSSAGQFLNSRLLDNFDQPFPAPMAEDNDTMASYYARYRGNENLAPSLDIIWEDEWTADDADRGESICMAFSIPQTPDNPSQATPPGVGICADAGMQLDVDDVLSDQPPVAIGECLTRWNSLCRSVINYQEHIQTIWDFSPRMIPDGEGIPQDQTCINCHNVVDITDEAMPAMLPQPNGPGENQLNLSTGIDNAAAGEDFVASYGRLFNARRAQELIDGGTFQDERKDATNDDNIDFTLVETVRDELGNPLFQVVDVTPLLGDPGGIQILDSDDNFLQATEVRDEDNNIVVKMTQEEIDGVLQFQVIDINGDIISAPMNAAYTIVLDFDGNPIPAGDVDGIPQFEAIAPDGSLTIAPLDITPRYVLDDTGDLSPSLIPLLDENGMEIPEWTSLLDNDGNPIPVRILTRRPLSNLFNGENARASQAFFDVFNPGGAHEGYLTPAELKLISEWLDIGGQYYNDPFETLDD